LTLPNQSDNPFPNTAGGHQTPPFEALIFFVFEILNLMPDDLFKKLPKFGKINFGTA
jgi:hypothetical protein